MRRNTRLLALGVLSTVLLAGCGSDDSASKSSSSSATTAAETPLTVAADKVASMSSIKVDDKN